MTSKEYASIIKPLGKISLTLFGILLTIGIILTITGWQPENTTTPQACKFNPSIQPLLKTGDMIINSKNNQPAIETYFKTENKTITQNFPNNKIYYTFYKGPLGTYPSHYTCRKGYRKGENLNHYYCALPVHITITDKKGYIQAQDTPYIIIELEPNPYGEYKIVNQKCVSDIEAYPYL